VFKPWYIIAIEPNSKLIRMVYDLCIRVILWLSSVVVDRRKTRRECLTITTNTMVLFICIRNLYVVGKYDHRLQKTK
jgi:hypothetical protein